jgi:hypothetical protein
MKGWRPNRAGPPRRPPNESHSRLVLQGQRRWRRCRSQQHGGRSASSRGAKSVRRAAAFHRLTGETPRRYQSDAADLVLPYRKGTGQELLMQGAHAAACARRIGIDSLWRNLECGDSCRPAPREGAKPHASLVPAQRRSYPFASGVRIRQGDASRSETSRSDRQFRLRIVIDQFCNDEAARPGRLVFPGFSETGSVSARAVTASRPPLRTGSWMPTTRVS